MPVFLNVLIIYVIKFDMYVLFLFSSVSAVQEDFVHTEKYFGQSRHATVDTVHAIVSLK